MNLRTMLLDTIDNIYLIKDNKEPITIGNYVCSMFSTSGKDGRIRAVKYKNEVLNNLKFSDDVLAAKVFIEAKATESTGLENSTKLRNRLLLYLCKYYKVNEAEIEEKADSLVKYGYEAYPVVGTTDVLFGYVAIDTKEDHLKDAMVELLVPHIDVNVCSVKFFHFLIPQMNPADE